MVDSPAAFSWHHLNQWILDPVPIVIMLAAGALYVWAARRTSSWPLSRVVYFALALVVTFIAIQSVVGVYDRSLFADHMIQHLLLIMVAAPLFALSAPLDLCRQAGPAVIGRILDSRPVTILLHPIVGFAIYAAFIPATHLTSLFNVMLEHEWLHNLEHVGFLVIGYFLFRAAFGLEQGTRLNPGLRLVFIMVAVPVDTITGLALAMEIRNPFPAYEKYHVHGAGSILSDIHLGGAIMWIGGDGLMLLALIPIAVTWVRYETRKTRELDAELDAMGL